MLKPNQNEVKAENHYYEMFDGNMKDLLRFKRSKLPLNGFLIYLFLIHFLWILKKKNGSPSKQKILEKS